MQTIVLLFSVSVALFTIALFYDQGKKRDSLERRKKQLGQTVYGNRSEELSKPLTERVFVPIKNKFFGFLSKVRLTSKIGSKNSLRDERLLRQAGIRATAEGYQQFKVIISVICILISAICGIIFGKNVQQMLLFILIGPILSLLLPNYYVKSRAKNRSRKMREALPDVMDMLSVCVEAGLGLDGAIIRIAEKNKNAMTDELMLTIKEIQFGRTRRDAFKDLGDRYDIGEIKTFASAMVQGEKYGVPVKGILKTQAAKLRDSRKKAAQEKAMKSPVKIMIPIVIFIFPVIFIILMGPSVINIMDTMLK